MNRGSWGGFTDTSVDRTLCARRTSVRAPGLHALYEWPATCSPSYGNEAAQQETERTGLGHGGNAGERRRGGVHAFPDGQVGTIDRAVVIRVAIGKATGTACVALPGEKVFAVDVDVVVEVGRIGRGCRNGDDKWQHSRVVSERGRASRHAVICQIGGADLIGLAVDQ